MVSKGLLALIVILVIILAVGFLLGPSVLKMPGGTPLIGGSNSSVTTVSSTQSVTVTTVVATTTVTTTLSGEGSMTPVDLFKKVEGSVVAVLVTLPNGSAQGSGFVYDDQGHIVTNNHVVDSAQSISVAFLDGTSVSAKIVGTDVYGDLAVISIPDQTHSLKPVPLGDSSSLQVGQQVAAIGNPFGLSGSMSLGIVSQLGRSTTGTGGYLLIDLVQTDAAVNPGNSGGPLLNMQGQVIGVNTMIFTQSGASEGVGLAIPSNTVKRIADSLIKTGVYKHPWVGIQGLDITPDVAKAMSLSEAKGFLVLSVLPNSPAAKAGLKGSDRQVTVNGQSIPVGGDVIVGIDNITTRDLNDLLLYTERNKSPGDTITLKIIRDGKEMSVNIVLGERPQPTG
ncbi:MAG: trypsin-like peptidase domain-containing protein [Thaumarchaeota archaeon]|nr:trypsin-like peptidase domain-containing protein [Nitrososphaerota archaeon]MCL5318172.1 trypsin-like peptidase domain-containing protein [Nitrososphaerota archaeon]